MLIFCKILYSFLFAINVVVFFLFAFDKQKALFSERRIPELLLLVLSGFGGAYGAGAAMLLFRHKTRKMLFLTLVPLFFVLWIIGLIIITTLV